MKRLYKIIILFLLIFFIGIFFTIKSINSSFSTDTAVETVSIPSTISKLTIKL